jgi:NAD+-dependent protein deacetylase sirtuin 4
VYCSKNQKIRSFLLRYQEIDGCDKLLLMGTTLATYSAFRLVQFNYFLNSVSGYSAILIRLVKHAIELKKPVLLLNVGPTRADGLPGLVKLDVRSGAILGDVTRAVMYGFKTYIRVVIHSFISFSGSRARADPLVAKMLRSGIENPPLSDDDDRHPRAAGKR